ncbi:tetratricopeptide repeat protein [Apilactobacillus apisilvae]|uniref:Tetratricopeptide repeat protein n=1 Tax=Apilactobacillus apisilvae TaxID=2923364 RepID=A0ABY4PIY6_9LACO|nr:tetratricopeptide repeat protein [Apilactobacillus apisilvae]UQS85532.1 tetratricopeptide repeat protein [Apilactobacillus apisilvae]
MENNDEKLKNRQSQVQKEHEKRQKKADKTLHNLVTDIDEHPHDYRTYYDLGAFLVELHNFTQAEELMMKALGLFANQSKKAKEVLTYGLGNVYYAAGEFDKSIEQFNSLSSSDLKSDSYIMLAQSYMGKKDYKKAVVFALTAQGFRRQDPDVNYLLGSSLMALGNFSEAAQFLDTTLKAQPKNGKANFDRGIVAMVLGENFSNYFNKSKKYDEKYFNDGQKRLSDIEKYIQAKQSKK